ncbi:hypothetical protein AB834_04950 [PVC group bacterium (ex Bugula neritina AB1)]|nr:hypothetical protein AB834_04950 [PVC group bacterium (ex Bugula neritina AB1)]
MERWISFCKTFICFIAYKTHLYFFPSISIYFFDHNLSHFIFELYLFLDYLRQFFILYYTSIVTICVSILCVFSLYSLNFYTFFILVQRFQIFYSFDVGFWFERSFVIDGL